MKLDPQALAEILSVARELDAHDRSAYLDEITGGDKQKIAQVRAALALTGDEMPQDQATVTSNQPPGASAFGSGAASPSAIDGTTDQGDALPAALRADLFTDTEKPGSTVGRYKLLQKIGEGGFGAVYMAEQLRPVQRRVALKIIKAGMDTRQVIARFEAERQALAMMNHPYIAKVLDAGATDNGRPYFVMELVKGVPITDYCDEARLDTRARLELFKDICSAIQHAHLKGIIHRDLKPSNIMVTLHGGKPVVKVIDFGIAKATNQKLTEKTLFTSYGQMIGTPAYMSPEQAVMSGLDVDTRSDIYSLGVLLYELLAGRTPIDDKTLREAGFDEMRRIIREQEPPRPSTRLSTMDEEQRGSIAGNRQVNWHVLCRELRGDLDWIILKALEKDRNRRYESASDFAQDIDRYLRNEPVEAAAPTLTYRARKFVHRNKGPVAVAAVIGLLLVSGTVVSSWLAIRATQAEQDAVAALAEVKTERDAKERIAEREEALARFYKDILRSPNPRINGTEVRVVDALRRAGDRIDKLADQPERQAQLRIAIGETYHGLGLRDQAIEQLEQARQYYATNHPRDHPDRLSVHEVLAFVYREIGQADKAAQYTAEVLELRKQKLGPDHADTLRAMINHANSLDALGRSAEALAMREEARLRCKDVLGEDDEVTLTATTNLANSYQQAGRHADAFNLRQAVLPLYERKMGPNHPDTLMAMNNLANSYSRAGQHDQALELRKKVWSRSLSALGSEHPARLNAMINLAATYLDVGDKDNALQHAREAVNEVIRLDREVDRRDPREPSLVTLEALAIMANCNEAVGEDERAFQTRKNVHDILLRYVEAGTLKDQTPLFYAKHNLAISYQKTGRWDLAIQCRLEMLDLVKAIETQGSNPGLRAWALDSLATTLAEHGQTGEALARLEAAHRSMPDDMAIALKLATLNVWLNQHDKYDALRGEVIKRVVAGEPVSDPGAAARLLCLLPADDPKIALAAADLAEQAAQQDATPAGRLRAELAAALATLRLGEYTRASAQFADVTALADEHDTPASDVQATTATLYQSLSLKQAGQADRAAELFNHATRRCLPLPSDASQPLVTPADPAARALWDTQQQWDVLLQWLAYRETQQSVLARSTTP